MKKKVMVRNGWKMAACSLLLASVPWLSHAAVIGEKDPVVGTEDQAVFDWTAQLEEGNYDQVIEQLAKRHECRLNATYAQCGMDADEVVSHVDEYGMSLLYKMVTMDRAETAEEQEKQLSIVEFLVEEGADYVSPLESDGDNALSLSLKYENKDVFLFLLEASGKNARDKAAVLDVKINGDKISHIAAKFVPEDSEVHNKIADYGFDLEEKNRKKWSVTQLRRKYGGEL